MGVKAKVERGPDTDPHRRALRAAQKAVASLELELESMQQAKGTPREWIAGCEERLNAARARVVELGH